MRKTPFLSREQVAAVEEIATIAAGQAGNALSRLLKIPIRVGVPEVTNVKLSDIPALFGGLDAPAIGVLVPFQGDIEGNALLLFPEAGIKELEEMLFGSSGQAEGDLRLSAFAEIGNIITGSLLTVFWSFSERVVVNLPPFLVQDMAGAILDAILGEVGTLSDEVTTLTFNLTGLEDASLVKSVLIPGNAGIELFLEAAGRLRTGR
ncbi:MAG: chemotaxis protein CheC [bacterium]|nr:chemotaxis protein CheC [bacterium]